MIPPHVCYWHKADTLVALRNVRFRGIADIALMSAFDPNRTLVADTAPSDRTLCHTLQSIEYDTTLARSFAGGRHMQRCDFIGLLGSAPLGGRSRRVLSAR